MSDHGISTRVGLGAILSVFVASIAFCANYPKSLTEVVPVAPEVKSPIAFTTNLFSAKCIKVLSGDTFEIAGDKGKHLVRLCNVTAPIEPQAWGKESKKFLQHLIEGKTIALDSIKRDVQNRLLSHVYYRSTDIEILMVRAGLAYAHVAANADQDLEKAQKLAQKEKRGIWQESFPKQSTKKGTRHDR